MKNSQARTGHQRVDGSASQKEILFKKERTQTAKGAAQRWDEVSCKILLGVVPVRASPWRVEDTPTQGTLSEDPLGWLFRGLAGALLQETSRERACASTRQRQSRA